MSALSTEFDIMVVGGGPAGSVAATQLARLGFNTLLLDRDGVRPMRVETIAAGASQLLDSIGADGTLQNALIGLANRVRLRWGNAQGDVFAAAEKPTWLVDRAKLDAGLHAFATMAGVQVVKTHGNARIQREQGGWLGRTHQDTFRARFLIDARGRAEIAAQLSPLARNVALGCQWSVDLAQSNEMVTEALSEHWLWAVTLSGGFRAVEVICDLDRCRGLSATARLELIAASLAESKWLSSWGADLDTLEVTTRPASTFAARQPVGADYLKIGDAALAVDPITGQGLSNAIRTGVQAGPVVNTILAGHDRSHSSTAIEFCEQRQQETWLSACGLVADAYADQQVHAATEFWVARSKPSSERNNPVAYRTAPKHSECENYQVTQQLSFTRQPAIVDDFIESCPAVTHPDIVGGLTFVADVAVSEFLTQFRTPKRVEDVQFSSNNVSRLQMLEWCVQRRLLEIV